jgi:hypothetical protein
MFSARERTRMIRITATVVKITFEENTSLNFLIPDIESPKITAINAPGMSL